MKPVEVTMNILIIDDQIDVVLGIVKGVNWVKLHIKNIETAYTVVEAKSVFERTSIDLMLCDIEMPGENGLELFAWVKVKYKDTECVFLTSHADFGYAKKALELGSFDYILQPARYEEIETVIEQVKARIKEKREVEEIYKCGKIFKNRQEEILNSALIKFIENNEDNLDLIVQLMKKKGGEALESKVCTPVLMHVMRWKTDISEWRDSLLIYAFQNVLKELLETIDYNVNNIVAIDSAHYFFLAVDMDEEISKVEKLANVLEYFIEFSEQYFKTDMAIYVGERAPFVKQGGCVGKLRELKKNNIMQKTKVEFYLETINEKQNTRSLIKRDVKRWYDLFMRGHGKIAREEILRQLREMAAKEQLSSDYLEEFHQDFTQIIYSAVNEKGWKVQKIFPSREYYDKYIEGYHTLDDLIYWVEEITNLFSGQLETATDEKSQVEKVKEYILQNTDKNISRTELADFVYLNSEYLSRLFKKETGYSLKDYILNEKVNVAKSLLSNTNLSVSIVASKVGFSNFSHFTQVFKKIEDMTPVDYRKMCKED